MLFGNCPNIGPAGASVTVSWSGITNPIPWDWTHCIPRGLRTRVVLLSCARNPGAANASGSCGVGVPSDLSGTYELRLLANDGFTRLATSNPFTVNTGLQAGISQGR